MSHYEIKSEITGSVWKILKAVGDMVEEGDELMVLESMKMEIPLICERTGTLREVRVAEGASVAEGDTVMTIEC
jgi:acetyl-CoA carboxylase biotin carboxyl carrier protein